MAHDELLFIIVHQSFELWFHQILFELESARDAMFQGRTFPARHYLKRVHSIERMLIDHIGIIETMSPQDFLQFRSHLAPASGFQSNLEVRRASLLKMMRDKEAYPELFYTAESLLTHDEQFALWRHHHILMVERQIGSKSGTGGTAGIGYLRTTLDKRFYPELWDLRSYL